jgi:hypothetical protein
MRALSVAFALLLSGRDLDSLISSAGMTEKEYEALYEALEAAHKILPGDEKCDAKDLELRKKIRKLEKAVLKRQKKAAREERKEKK